VPSVVPNPRAIRPFASEAEFEAWLSHNHDKVAEIWIKIFKKASGKPSIDASQAIDVGLCWGWIDGIRKPLDDEAFLQRYTPRGPKSRWSQINVERVAKLTKAGRMTPHGLRHVDAAKADGRWDAAYASPKSIEVPTEFLKAVSKRPGALEVFRTLNRSNTYAFAYRLHHLKTEEGRARFIATWVEKLARGEMPHPASPSNKKKEKKRARR
jgi:uncharacterized protein YdeI (YjbR/CyaY-like superfamily)